MLLFAVYTKREQSNHGHEMVFHMELAGNTLYSATLPWR
jgi:hypothetical protein